MSNKDLENDNQLSLEANLSHDLSPASDSVAGHDSDDFDEYLECYNQLHFFEKYYEKTGKLPPGYFENSEPGAGHLRLPVNENLEEFEESSVEEQKLEINYNDVGTQTVGSAPIDTENKKQQIEISSNSTATQTIFNASRCHKRRRHTIISDGESDKENHLTPLARKVKRSCKGKEHEAIDLLRNTVNLSEKAIDLALEAASASREASKLLQDAINLVLGEH